jgi:hypothetical protein
MRLSPDLVTAISFPSGEAPIGWHIPAAIVYALCPAVYSTITVDPSFPSVALILGPINASVYGVAGLAIGLLWFAT